MNSSNCFKLGKSARFSTQEKNQLFMANAGCQMHKKTTLYVKRNVVSCVNSRILISRGIRAVEVLIRDSVTCVYAYDRRLVYHNDE